VILHARRSSSLDLAPLLVAARRSDAIPDPSPAAAIGLARLWTGAVSVAVRDLLTGSPERKVEAARWLATAGAAVLHLVGAHDASALARRAAAGDTDAAHELYDLTRAPQCARTPLSAVYDDEEDLL
jgi:hypothetical protein